MMQRALLIDHFPGAAAIAGSGIGSSLFKLAAAADAFHAQWNIDLLTSPPKAQLFAHSPVFRNIATDIAAVEFATYQRIVLLGISLPENVVDAHCSSFTDVDKQRYKITPHIAFWRSHLAHALNYPLPDSPASFPVVITPDERAAATQLLDPHYRWIGLCIQAISYLKDYKRWDDVVNLLLTRRRDLAIVLLGNEQCHANSSNARMINLCGKTTIREAMAIITQCAVIAGSDGLITNLGLVLGRPTVTLFSIIAPEHVVDPHQARRSRVINLVDGNCPLQFCYPQLENYRYSACPLDPMTPQDQAVACMRFHPETIYETMITLLA